MFIGVVVADAETKKLIQYITSLNRNMQEKAQYFWKTPASYKLGNVKMDLKKALAEGLEFAASIGAPESIRRILC